MNINPIPNHSTIEDLLPPGKDGFNKHFGGFINFLAPGISKGIIQSAIQSIPFLSPATQKIASGFLFAAAHLIRPKKNRLSSIYKYFIIS